MKRIFLTMALLLFVSGLALAQAAPAPVQIIDGPRVEGVGDTWAVIAWTTNVPSSSIVHYGVQSDRALSQTGKAPYADGAVNQQTTHRVRLTNLQPNTHYSFQADSGEGKGTGTRSASRVQEFTTKPAGRFGGEQTAQNNQIIDGPRVERVGDTWAVIAWTTNVPSSSIVHYGVQSDRRLSQTAEAPYADGAVNQETNHRVRLANLQPDTHYYFQVDSGEGKGTGTRSASRVQEFTTKPAGRFGGEQTAQNNQIIDGPRVERVGGTWAVIAWTTNVPSSSIVHYGVQSDRRLSQTAEAPYADGAVNQETNHRVRLTNLQPNTQYYFQVDSGEGKGTGTRSASRVQRFTTKTWRQQ